jgi:AraC-like DNA-binding protein
MGRVITTSLLLENKGKEMTDTIEKTREHIEKNYASIKRIQSVALELGLPYHRLRRVFARVIGKSMRQYLEEVRVNQARWKISDGKKLYTVAREVGWASETTLIKHFKNVTGMTPREYYELFKDDQEEL